MNKTQENFLNQVEKSCELWEKGEKKVKEEIENGIVEFKEKVKILEETAVNIGIPHSIFNYNSSVALNMYIKDKIGVYIELDNMLRTSKFNYYDLKYAIYSQFSCILQLMDYKIDDKSRIVLKYDRYFDDLFGKPLKIFQNGKVYYEYNEVNKRIIEGVDKIKNIYNSTNNV